MGGQARDCDGRVAHRCNDLVSGPIGVGGSEQSGNSSCEWGRCAGSHGLDIGGVAEVETAKAVIGVGGETVDGVGFSRAAGSANPSAGSGVAAVWIAAAGSREGVQWRSIVAVVGEGDRAGRASRSRGGVLGAGGVGGGDYGEYAACLRGELDVFRVGEIEAVVAGRGDEDDIGLLGGVGNR